jgi:lipid A 3-O-deacylase
MSHFFARGKALGGAVFATLVGAAAVLAGTAVTAAAQSPDGVASFFAISEVRAGVLATNLENSKEDKADYLINGEILFGQPVARSSNSVWENFLRPRVHVGFNVTPEDDGVNQLYAGLTWEYRLTNWAFIETSFGGAVHDGSTAGNDTNSYGCVLNFHESAGVGFDLNERWRLLVSVDHMSNAGLCDQNQGLTNAGVRLGYRW